MRLEQKFRALQVGMEFLYSDRGPDFGDFGGCGEASQILTEAARMVGLKGIEFQYGHAYTAEEPGEPIGHAWLVVDEHAIFDPAALAHGYEVVQYDEFDPKRPGEFQSDLLECLIVPEDPAVKEWARRTARWMRKVLGA